MALTHSTFVLVPFFIVLAILFRKNLLALTIASSVVQAASVLDISVGGSAFGVPIWMPLLAVSSVAAASKRSSVKKEALRRHLVPNRPAVISLTVFFLYGVLSAFLMPFIFRGIPLDAGMSTRHDGESTLRFSSTNLTQSVYLILGAVIFYLVAFRLTRESKAKALEYFLNACTIAAFIGFYQIASAYLGWYFPDEILYSNSAYVQLYGTQAAELYRLNATFTEASIAGLFLSGAFGIAIARCASPKPRFWDLSRCLIVGLALILTLSSTAYATLTLGFIYFASLLFKRAIRSTQATSLAIGCMVLFLAISYAVSQSAWFVDKVDKVTETEVSGKENSSSYNQRHTADLAALDLFWNTSLIGGGAGSCRASSALVELLGNTGVPGTLAFCSSIWFLLVRRQNSQDSERIGRTARLALALTLLAHIISVPDLVFPPLWGLMGILAGPFEATWRRKAGTSITRDYFNSAITVPR